MKKYGLRLNEDRLPMLVMVESFRYKGSRETAASPEKTIAFFREREEVDRLSEEHVYILAVDTQIKTLGYFELSIGGSNYSPVDKKGLFRRLLAVGAAGFIIVHNHPSGDPTPSRSDLSTFRELKDASRLLEITLHDFIICGNPGYYSFAKNGLAA